MELVRTAVYYCIEVIDFLILVRCILSWLPIESNFFIEFIYTLTDPILEPIRKLIGKTFGYGLTVDFSPIIAFLILSFIQSII